MASSFRQWESDPLFSAAEVVQDSADRMESIFRLLSHERSLVQDKHPDPKLLTSIEYHKRDLATTLETAKWQLEDFEREVNLSAMRDKSQTKQNVISSHKQFIRAIREQISQVEKSLEDSLVGDPMRNTEWINLNEQDRDGLALFISGGKPVEHEEHNELDKCNGMRRFLDPTASSSFSEEIVEHKTGKIASLNMNGGVNFDHDKVDLVDNKLRNVGSYYYTLIGSEEPSSIQEPACDGLDQDGSWDLEANEAKGKSFFHKNKLRGYYGKMNVFGSLGNLMSAYGSNTNRSFTKRWKDGEEQEHFSSYIDASHDAQSPFTQLRLRYGYSIFQRLWAELFARVLSFSSWLEDCWTRYQRSSSSMS